MIDTRLSKIADIVCTTHRVFVCTLTCCFAAGAFIYSISVYFLFVGFRLQFLMRQRTRDIFERDSRRTICLSPRSETGLPVVCTESYFHSDASACVLCALGTKLFIEKTGFQTVLFFRQFYS